MKKLNVDKNSIQVEVHLDVPCGAPGRLQVFLRAADLPVREPQLQPLERREPSPVRLAGVPEAPCVLEVQLLEGRGHLRHELHNVHFQVAVVVHPPASRTRQRTLASLSSAAIWNSKK